MVRECNGGRNGKPGKRLTAILWKSEIQSCNASYDLFLKHRDMEFMPPSYRGRIIFVDDTQGYSDKTAFPGDMYCWAETFKPNRVFFQYGYDSDRSWWELLNTPPIAIGGTLASVTSQECGLFRVDFNLAKLQSMFQSQRN